MGIPFQTLKHDAAFRRELDEWIAAHRDEMVHELIQWASHPSVSRADLAEPGAPFGRDCREMLDFALRRGTDYGFTTENYEGYCGAIRYGTADEEIGFVCHTDIVPPGDNWIHEPYRPFEKDGFLIGRGVSDNKYSGVVILFVMRFLKEKGISLKHGIRLFLGCAEETGMADFKWYVNTYHGKLPQLTIVPDCMFPVNYAQKGGFGGQITIPAGADIVAFDGGNVVNNIPDKATITVKNIPFAAVLGAIEGDADFEAAQNEDGTISITAHGKAGHAAFPERGAVNAITLLAQKLVETGLTAKADLAGVDAVKALFLSPFGEGLGVAYEDAESGRLTLNAGIITKREDQLEVQIDIRYPVTQEVGAIVSGIEAAAASFGAKLVHHHASTPFYISPEDERVTSLMEVYRDISGRDDPPYTMGGGTYSRVIPNAISFGARIPENFRAPFLPAGHGGGHGPDESMNIDNWLVAFKIYTYAILQLDTMELERTF